MVITSLKQKDIPEIVSIANAELGAGFITKKNITSYLKSKNTFCIAAWSDEFLVGFSIIKILPVKTFIAKNVLSQKRIFIKALQTKKNIAYRMHTVVKSNFQKKGTATALINYAEKNIYKNVDAVISVAWVKNKQCLMSKILLRNNFIKCAELKKYWENDSINKKYICSECKGIPCCCNAILFLKPF